jgi:hypothetical protein
MPNYQQQMVGSGFRDALYPTQNTRVDMQIPESIANPVVQNQEMYNPYSDAIYSNPIGKPLPSIPKPDNDETVSEVGSYTSMALFPFNKPSALFKTGKFNIDNANDNMSEPNFPIYSVFVEPALNEKSKEYDESKVYVVYHNNPMQILKKEQEAKDAKKINQINKDYHKIRWRWMNY